MKRFRLAFLYLLFALSHQLYSQEVPLFPIFEDGKFGFINQAGQTIIPPAFMVAQDFSEGLAAVRTKEGYGYIDLCVRVSPTQTGLLL